MTAAPRHVWVVLALLAVWLAPARAQAWVETHVLADDVRIDVERSGMATVDHAITMRVQGGPLRSFDVVGADRDAAPLSDSSVVSAQPDGPVPSPIPLLVALRPDGALRVSIDHPRGLYRGTFLFHVRYRTNLLGTGALDRDGAMVRLTWVGASFSDGIDAARCTIALPSAPTAPRGVGDRLGEGDEEGDPGASEAGAFLTTVRRLTDHDEIELVRPHVARAERVAWSVRVDPRALGEVNDPRLRPPPAAAPNAAASERKLGWGSIAGALLVAFSLLVALKARQVTRHAAAMQVRPRPLLPIGTTLRALLAGPALAGGALVQVTLDDPIWGTLLVLVAMALTTYLAPRWRARPRGPGRWLPIGDADAFGKVREPSGSWLDVGTRTGRRIAAVTVVLVAGAAFAAAHFASPYHAYLVAFDALALVPVFATGRLAQLPPNAAVAPAPVLRRVAKRLRKQAFLRAIAWARLPQGSDTFDELRLLVSPRIPRRGFGAIEVGVAFARGTGGRIALPQVLVRVVDASPCHEALSELLGSARWVRGRKPDERVAIVTPRLPTVAMTASLALGIAEAARDVERAAGGKRAPSHRPRTRLAPSAAATAAPSVPLA